MLTRFIRAILIFVGVSILLCHFSYAQESIDHIVISPSAAKQIKKTVKAWSIAHEKWDIEGLRNLYSDSLIFYTQKLSENKALSKVTGMFRPSELFKHKIISDIDLKILQDGNIKCNFTKEVTTKGKTKSYPSYLVLEKKGDKFLVCAEGDYITDKNLNFDYEESLNIVSRITASKSNSVTENKWTYAIISIFVILLGIFFYNKRSPKPAAVEEQILQSAKEVKLEKVVESNVPHTDFDINKQKGDKFETYVVGKFDPNYFTSLHWRSDKAAHGHFPKSNKDPDLEFEFNFRDYSCQFAVECKYRSQFNTGYIEICDQYKLNLYRTFESEKRMQVYIVIGVGGQPSDPEELFVIPLPHIKSNKIHRQELNNDYKKSLQSRFFYDTDLHMLT